MPTATYGSLQRRHLARVGRGGLRFVLCSLFGCVTEVPPSTDGGSDLGAQLIDSDLVDWAVDDADEPTDAADASETSPDAETEVDASSMDGKILMGYQGWFAAEGDDSPASRWRHWSRGELPDDTNITFDAWPDLTELRAEELHDTAFRYADGSVAGLYSAWHPRTVGRHFEWMRDYGIDGVFLQQFVSELREGSSIRAFRDRVTANVHAGAEATGRVFAIMYDVSGADPNSALELIGSHWAAMRAAGVTDSDRYLRHRGQPLVAVWGLGFADRPLSAAQAMSILAFFREQGATVMGGVPTYWRTLSRDADPNPEWSDVYRSFDVLSPWSVGRFADDDGVRNYVRDTLAGDAAETGALGIDLVPVVWPGFSWSHLMPGEPLNAIPRRGGRFWWTQFHQMSSVPGVRAIYGAMFDEVDEATAMFKLAPSASEAPANGRFLTLDADGEALPSDWYLRLAGQAVRALRGEIPNTPLRPIDPE